MVSVTGGHLKIFYQVHAQVGRITIVSMSVCVLVCVWVGVYPQGHKELVA